MILLQKSIAIFLYKKMIAIITMLPFFVFRLFLYFSFFFCNSSCIDGKVLLSDSNTFWSNLYEFIMTDIFESIFETEVNNWFYTHSFIISRISYVSLLFINGKIDNEISSFEVFSNDHSFINWLCWIDENWSTILKLPDTILHCLSCISRDH